MVVNQLWKPVNAYTFINDKPTALGKSLRIFGIWTIHQPQLRRLMKVNYKVVNPNYMTVIHIELLSDPEFDLV